MDERKDMTVSVDEGVWCVVRMAGRSAMGRLRGIKRLDDKARTTMEGTIRNNSGLEFDVVLDYFSPIRPVPVVGQDGKMQINPQTGHPVTTMGRETIVTNFEFVIEPCPMKLFGIECCVPLDDMQTRDKNLAKQLIHEALVTLDARRGAESGLVTPEMARGEISEMAIQDALRKALATGGPLPPGVTRVEDTPDGKPHFKIDLRQAAGR